MANGLESLGLHPMDLKGTFFLRNMCQPPPETREKTQCLFKSMGDLVAGK